MKITYSDVKPFVDALIEGLRMIAIATVSFLLSTLVINNAVKSVVGTYLPPEIVEAIIAAIFLVLRVVDKYLHLVGKVEDNDALKGGLTRF